MASPVWEVMSETHNFRIDICILASDCSVRATAVWKCLPHEEWSLRRIREIITNDGDGSNVSRSDSPPSAPIFNLQKNKTNGGLSAQ
jgi:hypothetical protein